jgi:hypothetical protein
LNIHDAHDVAVNTLIVGGGPAGLAPLISASRSGLLDQILAGGLAIVEQGATIGAGNLGTFAINSDTTADTLTNCILESSHPVLAKLRDHPATIAVGAHGRGTVALALAGDLMTTVGSALHEVLVATGNPVLVGHEALDTRQTGDGFWRTRLRRASDGAERTIQSRFVVLATGGHQPDECLESQYVGGVPLLPTYADKLIQSGDALTAAGLERVIHRLSAGRNQRVAIIGSSSSAMATANAILRTPFGQRLDHGAVTVLHRRPLRVFYPSAAAALAEGYDEFGPDDICPISGFVFRFAGFRLDSRELVMAARGIGGRAPEKRLRLHRLVPGTDLVASNILDEADVIIAALGYRPRALPVKAASGRPISLLANQPGARPMVDRNCDVLDADGETIPGLLGIGLAAGFYSPEMIGGEPSFSGQTNGVWQWQNDVGALIARRLCQSVCAEPALVD